MPMIRENQWSCVVFHLSEAEKSDSRVDGEARVYYDLSNRLKDRSRVLKLDARKSDDDTWGRGDLDTIHLRSLGHPELTG
jgi:hypothetical protein